MCLTLTVYQLGELFQHFEIPASNEMAFDSNFLKPARNRQAICGCKSCKLLGTLQKLLQIGANATQHHKISNPDRGKVSPQHYGSTIEGRGGCAQE